MRNIRRNEVTPEEQVELGGGGGGGLHKVNGVFRHPKHSFYKTVSRVEFFFETSAYRFRVDGQKRRLSKTIIPYMSYSER